MSTDVETDGPLPGLNSMLSIGSAAFDGRGDLVSTFSANLEALPGASPDPRTMAWWAEHPEAWEAASADPEKPEAVMRHYEMWLRHLPGRPVFVAFPSGFDFMFVYWYLMTFVGTSPFGRSALDVRSYAMAVLGRTFGECRLEAIADELLPDRTHRHVALDDAIEQGQIFFALLERSAPPGAAPTTNPRRRREGP